LAKAGATVYATGRSVAHASLANRIVAVPCDHTNDEDVTSVFDRIAREHGRVDVLVNNAWGGYGLTTSTANARGR
jgi:NAD(P)-dependent dehydrogenase (short-subunit alcohol dehydrogenase family)